RNGRGGPRSGASHVDCGSVALGSRPHRRRVCGKTRSRLCGSAAPSPSPESLSLMLNIWEYRRKADRLADHLPWAALVAPGVVLNKDGSFQRTFRFRGPDLESATEAELVAACARINNILRRFGSGWALFFEADRFEAAGYPDSVFPDAASKLVDDERLAGFEIGAEKHFDSTYYLTLVYMSPPDAASRAERTLIEREQTNTSRDWKAECAAFVAETDKAFDLFGRVLPEIAALDDEETLPYLHGAVSAKRHLVSPPEIPAYLDAVLADTPLSGGLEPMLGDQHLRTITILGFPNTTRPGLLDALNHLDFRYRWTTRFIALDKADATKALVKIRRQWFNKRK